MNRNIFLVAIAIVVASVLIPFMQEGSFAGEVTDTVTVYRDGWFGPHTDRVTLDNGAVTYVEVYPWYFFKDFKPTTMDFTNILAGGGVSWVTSDQLFIQTKDASSSIPVTFTEKNNLYLTGRFAGIGDGPQVCTHSRVSLHPGLVTSDDDMEHAGMIAWSDETGPWIYGESWTTDLNIYAAHFNDAYGTHDFTVQETQWAKPTGNLLETAYKTDRAWIIITLYEEESQEVVDRGTGTITVTVMDNRVQTPAYVDVYKNGQLFKSLYLPEGKFVFSDLEFGTYRFVVTDSTYDTMFYDAFPQQLYFDYDVGEIELSSSINTVSYYIYGNFEGSDADPYNDPDDSGVNWENTSIDETVADPVGAAENLVDDVKGALGIDDGSLTLSEIITMIGALLASMGLLTSVAIIGLPVFIVVILFFLVAVWVRSGDKKTNYSPGNKTGGRK